MFVAEGRVFQGMDVSPIRTRCKPKLCGVPVSLVGMELSKVVRGIWLRV